MLKCALANQCESFARLQPDHGDMCKPVQTTLTRPRAAVVTHTPIPIFQTYAKMNFLIPRCVS